MMMHVRRMTMLLVATPVVVVGGAALAQNLTVEGSLTAGIGSTVHYLAGKLGIGVASPTEALEVAGRVKADDFVRSDGTPMGPTLDAYEARSCNATYQAQTDGFVIVNPGNYYHSYYMVRVDPVSPPTTTRVYGKAYSPSGSKGPATVPVPEGWYYQVYKNYGACPDNIWWMALKR